jgi:hypothetical protein
LGLGRESALSMGILRRSLLIGQELGIRRGCKGLKSKTVNSSALKAIRMNLKRQLKIMMMILKTMKIKNQAQPINLEHLQ